MMRKYCMPACPSCGQTGIKVKHTYFTSNDEIVRHRKCPHCNHGWWTVQEIEVALDPGTWKVKIPSWKKDGSRRGSARKKVTLERVS